MKNTIFNPRYIWLLLPILIFSCDNFVEVDQPTSQLTGSAVFENAVTANAAMTDIYSKIRDNGLLSGNPLGLSCLLGTYADELVSYEQGSTSTEPFYNNALIAANSPILDLWNATYSQVYAANAVIEGVSASPTLVQNDKDRLIGEALFTRALLHFYTGSVFGDCPYITTTNYRESGTAIRIPLAEVYTKCIADLEQAIILLPEAYTGENRVRPNRSAAQALLARVCVYNEAWPEAANAASAVLNNTDVYIWDENLDNTFLIGSTTTIWQLMSGSNGTNTKEGNTFIFESGPPPTVALSPELMAAFTPGDNRKTHWTRTIIDGTDSWSHAYKYKQQENTGSSVEYSVVLRLAEQYLIRAEARARQGELIGAREDLNKIRNTAGLDDSNATDAAGLITDIMEQRRLELFTEFGHRFLDLKRTNSLDAILSASKPGWDANDRLWPIPQSELAINPNLRPQNPGY